nr:hypothetical protein OG999_29275 [Streptomyces sp. NBC_00886]
MNVDDVVAEKIAAARRKAEREKQQREELAAARRRGLTARHSQKLRALAERGLDLVPLTRFDNTSYAASGAH